MDSSIIPFLPEVYDHILASYNAKLWPAQLIATLLGAAILSVTLKNKTSSSRFASISLGLAHLWIAWGYYVREFVDYSWGAWIFALLFGLQGFAFLLLGGLSKGLKLQSDLPLLPKVTTAVCIYALIFHPILAEGFPPTPESLMTFGLHPAPTLMFTFGILTMTIGRQKWLLLIASLLSGVLVSLLSNAMGHTLDLMVLPIALLSVILSAGGNRR